MEIHMPRSGTAADTALPPPEEKLAAATHVIAPRHAAVSLAEHAAVREIAA